MNQLIQWVSKLGDNPVLKGINTLRGLLVIACAIVSAAFFTGAYFGNPVFSWENREQKITKCDIEGLQIVEINHNDRDSILKKRLFDLQDRLLNQNLFTEERNSLLESIELLKTELVNEREAYLRAMNDLDRKCTFN